MTSNFTDMLLENDIAERLKKEFSPRDADSVIELFESSNISGRLARCIVVAGNGRIDSLRQYVEIAGRDYRDVIMAGEYAGWDKRIRDLSVSFLVDSPVKMWISGVAGIMQQRGYTLSSLDTTPTVPITGNALGDLGEVTAIFEGVPGKITITKRKGHWKLHGEERELELYSLSKTFGAETMFSDAVSCYILAKQNPGKTLEA